MTRLAFIDLDGTLLGPDARVSNANAGAVRRLRDAGYAIVFASGRHQRNIAMLLERRADGSATGDGRSAHLNGELGPLEWVVSSQGTVARHFTTGETIFERGLAWTDIVELEALARARDIGLIAYHREAVHVERMTPWIERYAGKAGWSPVVGPFHLLEPIGFQKVLLTTEPSAVITMRDEAVFSRFHAVITEPELLELLPPGTNKASAAEAVATKLGVLPSQTLAFGDGNNDVELLAWAGDSYAMAHGREAAKLAAKHVCPPGPPETAFARAVNEALK